MLEGNQIIFADVDGTVYGTDFKIHPFLKKDILFAKKLGFYFVLNTGNGVFCQMKKLASVLGATHVIGSNGASIWSTSANQFILKSKIPLKTLQKLVSQANTLKLGTSFWNEKHAFTTPHTTSYARQSLLSFMGQGTVNFIKNHKTQELELQTPAPFKVEMYGSPKQIKAYISKIKNLPLEIVQTKPHHMEITNKGTNKGSAAKWLSKKLGFSFLNSMCIGDSPNDLPMLKISDYSYAMGNATPEVQKTAKFKTKDFTKNGLGLAIRHYVKKTLENRS